MTDPLAGNVSPVQCEAQETIEAIHQGNVDALVINGPDGPQVVVLQGGDRPYQMLVERMSDGALTLGLDDYILYANRRLAEMTGETAASLIGREFSSLFESGTGSQARLKCLDGSVPVAVWISPIRMGNLSTKLATITDVSIQHQVKEVLSAERFARSLLEQSTEIVLALTQDGTITHASRIAVEVAGTSLIGKTFSEAFAVEFNDADPLSMVPAARLDWMLGTKPFHGVELKIGKPGGRSYLLSAGPLVDDARNSIGAIVTLTDITARKLAEEKQIILVAELNHRVKNILAVVQSVAAQTLRTAPSLSSFNATFSGRIRALAVAHDILTRTRWTGIGINELLEGVLSPYRSSGEPRVTLKGPPILLPARAIVPLSMAFHELATNASKYGSLSSQSGSVNVNWSLSRNGTSQVEMDWQESGGPLVLPGDRSGFGTTLIRRVIKHDLEGTVDLQFEPPGVKSLLSFPLRTQGEMNDLSGGVAL